MLLNLCGVMAVGKLICGRENWIVLKQRKEKLWNRVNFLSTLQEIVALMV
jgi:hypothetical protein